jgi:hypothetical protein
MAKHTDPRILRGKFVEGKEEEKKRLDRREMLRASVAGAAGLGLAGMVAPRLGRASFPGMGAPEKGMSYDSGPAIQGHTQADLARLDRGSVAAKQKRHLAGDGQHRHRNHGKPLDLNNILNVLWGTGLYIGNEYYNWSDDTKAAVHAQVASWGFNFVCPKVGGYGSTWYYTDDQLRAWRDSAWAAGIGYAPFIYSIPNSYSRDAQICSEITNAVGIAVVDMEDEWAYAYNQMTGFGGVYRYYNPYDPIIVTGYGDPITRFGSGVFPADQMTAWCDGYSPQWYYGVWSYYHYYGVQYAIDWADAECGNTFGWDYPLCPSMSIYSAYSGNGILPYGDIQFGEQYAWNWGAPIFWWEYSDMNSYLANACLGN